jgi:hypothetical protein
MMKIAFLAILFIFNFAWASDDHSVEVCSTKNVNACGHIGHMSGMTSSGEAQFVVHLTIPDDVQVTDLNIVLWMPEMCHGSSPVEFTQFGVNKYKVTQAFFVMPGNWVVRVNFKLEGEEHQIEIPIEIAE